MVVNRVKRAMYLKKYIKNNKELFEPGIYIIDRSLSYYVKREEQAYYSNLFNDKFKTEISLFQKSKNLLKLMIYFVYIILFGKSIKINSENTNNNDCILVTNKEKSIKLFSTEQRVITTVYSELELFEEYIKTRKLFGKYFKIPMLLSVSTEKLLTTERFKTYKQSGELTESDKEKVINALLDSLIKYAKGSSSVYETKEYNNRNYPIVHVHGDLKIKNILYNNGEVYFIDFGNVKNYFIFDFFDLIIYEYYIHHDSYYMQSYLNGNYDEKLKYLYNMYDLNYNINDKVSHVKVFLYFKNNKRLNKLVNIIERKYKDLIE